MAPPGTPFYLDWPFWSALSAVLTFALTQTPPLRLLFRRAKVEAEIYAAVMLPPFRRSPEEDWGHIVNFFTRPSREEDKRLRDQAATLRRFILGRKEDPEWREKLVEAPPDLWQSLKSHFDHAFKWRPGEYQGALEILTQPARAAVTKKFRFTVFESDARTLTDIADDYKYGAGVHSKRTDREYAVLIPLSQN